MKKSLILQSKYELIFQYIILYLREVTIISSYLFLILFYIFILNFWFIKELLNKISEQNQSENA